MITLDRFILEREHAHPGATGELSMLLMRFGVAGKRIARELAVAGLRRTLGSAGTGNVQGEEQKKLDVIANEILLETFDYGGLVMLAASEELEAPYVYESNERDGRYAVLFDPMDGSSNIDVNGTLGTIFSVRRREEGGERDLLHEGRRQVVSGYLLFGPAVLLVYADGDGVHIFTLDPSIGEFLLTSEGVKMPARGKGYAVNEGRSHGWAPEVRAFVEHLKERDPASGRPVRDQILGVSGCRCPPDPARGRHLSISGRHGAGRKGDGETAAALRVRAARVDRRAGRRRRDDRTRGRARRRAEDPARAHPPRDREQDRGGAVREVRAGGAVTGGPDARAATRAAPTPRPMNDWKNW